MGCAKTGGEPDPADSEWKTGGRERSREEGEKNVLSPPGTPSLSDANLPLFRAGGGIFFRSILNRSGGLFRPQQRKQDDIADGARVGQ